MGNIVKNNYSSKYIVYFLCVPYLPRFPEKKAVSSCGKSRLAGKKFQLWHKSVAGSA